MALLQSKVTFQFETKILNRKEISQSLPRVPIFLDLTVFTIIMYEKDLIQSVLCVLDLAFRTLRDEFDRLLEG